MVNKRGWVRIVEATICAILILTIILVHAQGTKVYFNIEKYTDVESVLDEMIREKDIRNSIISTDGSNLGKPNEMINIQLQERIKRAGIIINNTICNKTLIDTNSCPIPKTEGIKNVHVYERMISTSNSKSYDFEKDTRIIKVVIFGE